MKIYRDIAGVKTEIHDLEVDLNTELRQSISGEDLISCRFVSEGAKLDLQLGDYTEFKDSVYTILDEPQFKKAQNTFTYSLEFKSDQYILKNVQVLNENTEETEFFYFGDMIDMVSLIIWNMNRVYTDGDYYADYVEQLEPRSVAFKNENCLAALQRITTEFGCEFQVKGKMITVRKKIGAETGLVFEYKNGLKEIERQTLQNAELLTKLYATGSTRNITNEYGSKRLRIDPIENNVDIFGTIERAVTFEDIYPRLFGVVGSSSSSTRFVDTGIDFNINEQLIGGVKALVKFNTGDLAGREFEIAKYTSTTKEIELIPYTDDTDLTLPNEMFRPRVGDKYVLLGIKMPQAYIDNAEAELLERATEYLEKYSQPNVIYKVAPHYPALRKSQTDLNLGDIVTLKDADFGIEFQTRILSLRQKINNPYDYAIDLGNQVTVSYFSQVMTDQKNIRNNIYLNNKYITELLNRVYNNISGFTAPLYVNRGEFDAANYYYNNQNRRDYVFRMEGEGEDVRKVWYFYIGEDHARAEWIQANWQLIGDQFEIVATQTLLAENANIGYWLIQNGQIVSQASSYEGEANVQMNGLQGYLKFIKGIDVWGVGGYHRYRQEIQIGGDGDGFTAEREGDANQLPASVEVSSDGIFADFAGQNAMMPEELSQGSGAIVGKGKAKNALGDFIAGVVGWAENIYNSVPAFGGVFWALKSHGRYVGMKVIPKTTTEYTIEPFDEFLSCYNTSNLKIYLPEPYSIPEGREIRIKRVNSPVAVHGKLLAQNQREVENINDGDVWIFVNDGSYWLANYMGRTDS